ncbi:hypothetical protein COE80_19570 [Bacillus pseudomycoides]|uniref:hypothetical protein n=1 Tax=Bacillus pseudomycoides TaxID=64104 RepID=UPI000BFCE300|nr:hypothetical protein [Bacillus pseudomycoides]PHB22860.1 hypothetical protein COE80_19570 [Bacillus pseudomycoides]
MKIRIEDISFEYIDITSMSDIGIRPEPTAVIVRYELDRGNNYFLGRSVIPFKEYKEMKYDDVVKKINTSLF